MMASLFPMATGAAYNYAEVMQKALFFYRAQESGTLPSDHPVIWRGDSGISDGKDVNLDLTGGMYDAGDHVKFGLPLASTVSVLAWAVYEFGDALPAELLNEILDIIKWNIDYFVKAHPAPNVFYYQVGNGNADHAFWGSAEVLEEVMTRPSYKVDAGNPGSTVAAGTALSFALASIIFETRDPPYAQTCLNHAEELFDFAYNTKSDAGYREATGFYNSFSGFWDEISAAAAWLYVKTEDPIYLTKAIEGTSYWGKACRNCPEWDYKWTHSWDDKHYMAQIVLARKTLNPVYKESVERNLNYWLPGGGITYSSGGQAHLDQWGSLRYSSNAAFLALIWANDGLCSQSQVKKYKDFAESQINYALGDNPRSSSYVVGFGNNPPKNPHHRTAHGAWFNDIKSPVDNQHVLFGALVGGPKSADDSYVDDRTDYVMNEVACDYNAGFFGALAGLYLEFPGSAGSILANFPSNYFVPEQNRDPEYFVRAIVGSSSGTGYSIVTQTSNRSAWPAKVLSGMHFRFFFSIAEVIGQGKSIGDFSFSTGTNEGGTLNGPFLYDAGSHTYYLEVSFATAIYPAGRTECERRFEFSINGPAGFDPSNDWSYTGLGSGFTYEPVDYSGLTSNIPVYDGSGVLLHGSEPLVCSAICGNGVLDSCELCDGSELGGMTCSGLGYADGTLSCDGSCQFDVSGCSSACVDPNKGVPCTGTTNCCSGVGNCSKGKPANRACQ
uniref:Endoglucanase n=1 Tax=Pseudictyota dubia TaxID=2749911 RepID=A0A7R9VEF4_9STRA